MAMQQLAAAGQTVNQIQNSIQAVMDVAAIAQMDVGEAADQLGINRLTYGRLESPTRNEKVRQSTYERITEWLAKDY